VSGLAFRVTQDGVSWLVLCQFVQDGLVSELQRVSRARRLHDTFPYEHYIPGSNEHLCLPFAEWAGDHYFASWSVSSYIVSLSYA
jgi:hypothetical protein